MEKRMTIKEVEEILEIPRATIRFYEKNGLIQPERKDNAYRSYSEEDVAVLKRIILLRKLGFKVEEIADLQDGVIDLQELLNQNMIRLKEQLEEMNGALHMCERLKEENANMQKLAGQDYWELLQTEERKGNAFMSLAADVAIYGKHVFLKHFDMEDCEGGSQYHGKEAVWHVVLQYFLCVLVICLLQVFVNGEGFTPGTVKESALWPIKILIVTFVLGLPLYFIGKRNRKLAKAIKVTAYALFGIVVAFFVCLMILG